MLKSHYKVRLIYDEKPGVIYLNIIYIIYGS